MAAPFLPPPFPPPLAAAFAPREQLGISNTTGFVTTPVSNGARGRNLYICPNLYIFSVTKNLFAVLFHKDFIDFLQGYIIFFIFLKV